MRLPRILPPPLHVPYMLPPSTFWCDACGTWRTYDLLTSGHSAIPTFQICTRCGNGVATDEPGEAA